MKLTANVMFYYLLENQHDYEHFTFLPQHVH
jgi:hypothetical protein